MHKGATGDDSDRRNPSQDAGSPGVPGTANASPAGLPPRRRRTREDVTARITDAARTLFAERGYHGATTREIARLAAVSETLLFRHFGSKEALFDTVVGGPFDAVMRNYLNQLPAPSGDEARAREYDVYAAIHGLFEAHAPLFRALLLASPERTEAGTLPVDSLLAFFAEVTEQQSGSFRNAGKSPDFDLGIAIRLTFGMMAGSVLFRDWLFPEGAPPRDQILTTLQALVTRALAPGGDSPGTTTSDVVPAGAAGQ